LTGKHKAEDYYYKRFWYGSTDHCDNFVVNMLFSWHPVKVLLADAALLYKVIDVS